MTQTKQNLTDNELIAEFMGATIDHERTDGRKLWGLADLPEFCKQIDIPESRVRVFYEKDLGFHTSWDWLMPVVEKMYKLGYSVDIDSGNRRTWIHRNDTGLIANLPDYSQEFRGNKSYAHDLTPVQCVYQSVIDWLKWYNQQNLKG